MFISSAALKVNNSLIEKRIERKGFHCSSNLLGKKLKKIYENNSSPIFLRQLKKMPHNWKKKLVFNSR